MVEEWRGGGGTCRGPLSACEHSDIYNVWTIRRFN